MLLYMFLADMGELSVDEYILKKSITIIAPLT